MKKLAIFFIFFLSLNANGQIRHYLFIGMDRDLLKDSTTWTNDAFEGVQIAYSWRQLETEKDEYDFDMVYEDLELLKRHGKKLFIQIQDAAFSTKWTMVPKYLIEDSIYHGGMNLQYKFESNDETKYRVLGGVARRWDPAVQKRLHKLYKTLGEAFDGRIGGINTEETAADFGEGPLHPPGYSFKRYRDAIIENVMVLKKAFPNTVVMLYANFMPGGFIPGGDTTLLRSVYEAAWKKNIAVGGPDLLPYQRYQMNNSYQLIRESYQKVSSGVAVQDGTQEYIHPKTGKLVTAADIYSFAKEYLYVTYVFWGSEEPFLHSQVIPFLKTLK